MQSGKFGVRERNGGYVRGWRAVETPDLVRTSRKREDRSGTGAAPYCKKERRAFVDFRRGNSARQKDGPVHERDDPWRESLEGTARNGDAADGPRPRKSLGELEA
jgi:hypothetical protein